MCISLWGNVEKQWETSMGSNLLLQQYNITTLSNGNYDYQFHIAEFMFCHNVAQKLQCSIWGQVQDHGKLQQH